MQLGKLKKFNDLARNRIRDVPACSIGSGSEVHPTSCPMGTGSSFPGDQAARA
jgi:hypothetical protein